MSKNLVIVESPSKSKTIEKYLGKDYKVVSSKGHIRDLATTGQYGLGVDIENGFKPNYIPIKGKGNIIKELKKDVKNSDMVYLASDPDREGEAIAWHLKDALGIKDDQYKRILFHEITHDKVLDAIKNPTVIDDNLVKSQETRRILDRIIGFRLSKLLQSKIGAKSAGRVQSVALKLIVDREREIEAFNPEEYWTITAIFSDYEAVLFKYKTEDIELKNEQEANKVLEVLSDIYVVESVDTKEKSKKSKFPFITSTLQQEASTKLGFPAKKTMSIAQKLYEGIDLEDETVGLITYMRTDSTRLSDDFVIPARKYIEEVYGKNYVGFVKQSKKKENVQDAHEAIRPTSVMRTPEKVKPFLKSDEFKLYSLIYKRTLASLMADAKVNQTTIIFDNNDYKFKTTGQVLLFEGYLKIYKDYESSEEKILPEVNDKQECVATDVTSEQHFTKPPARYTEAKLIKELEELGIGRPSTYAKIIDTIKERNYVEMVDKKFKPTDMGVETTDKLRHYLPLYDYKGTSKFIVKAFVNTPDGRLIVAESDYVSLSIRKYKKPLVSLIIPAYNAEKTIRRCLDSLVSIIRDDVELLVINDGSGDRTGEICQEYAERYSNVRYFCKENGGVSSARNMGLDEAKGEYILFVDSDDFVTEEYFEISDNVTRIQPDFVLLGRYIYNGKSLIRHTTGMKDQITETSESTAELLSRALEKQLLNAPSSKIFKRNIIEKNTIRFDERLPIGEDKVFVVQYIMHASTAVTADQPVYALSVENEESLSRKKREKETVRHLETGNPVRRSRRPSPEKSRRDIPASPAETAYQSTSTRVPQWSRILLLSAMPFHMSWLRR